MTTALLQKNCAGLSSSVWTCGYTEARPFKTINRAVIEAGIITSKNYWDAPNIEDYQLVSIILAPGVHTALNGAGNDTINDANFPDWTSGDEPTDAELTTFNPAEGGIILPRGVSLCSLDLRKCTIRPSFVPAAADEAFTGNSPNNRSCIFRITGQGYYFGFTVRDIAGASASHHLLSAFEFADQTASGAGDLTNFTARSTAVYERRQLQPGCRETRGPQRRMADSWR